MTMITMMKMTYKLYNNIKNKNIKIIYYDTTMNIN